MDKCREHDGPLLYKRDLLEILRRQVLVAWDEKYFSMVVDLKVAMDTNVGFISKTHIFLKIFSERL